MADPEHVNILKQGVRVWNKWRKEHPKIWPDFWGANLCQANLARADLNHAMLVKANLEGANLRKADLTMADLVRVNLEGADLREADFFDTRMGGTILGDVDLSTVKGLDTVEHIGPSYIDIQTVVRSKGDIPQVFLNGARISEYFVAYARSLVPKPISYYTCFISYSNKDRQFVRQLYGDLHDRGIRCWLDSEDLKIGDEIRPRIDEAIRIHDKLLLVLSEHSVKSTWVEKEVETAFEKERQQNKLVLFPIRLDDYVMNTSQAWAADIRRTRHIGDFTRWKRHDNYQKGLRRLLRDLKTEPPRRL